MKCIKTYFDGIYLLESEQFADIRGCFYENFSEKKLYELGFNFFMKQENISISAKNVFRWMHFQRKYPQAKIVQVLSGEIVDFCLDIREESLNFGKIFSMKLSDKSPKLFISKGFAHGFLSLKENTKILYQCDEYYHPEDESGISWQYSEIRSLLQKYIDIEKLIISQKDAWLQTWNEFVKNDIWKSF